LKELFRLGFAASAPRNETEEEFRFDIQMKETTALLLALVSCITTIMNIVKGYWLMAGTTALLTLGYTASAVICRVLKKRNLAMIIASVLTAVIFTLYALGGKNEGFAILWILLIPPVTVSVMGLRIGTVLSSYFQTFLCVLFYTPLRNFVSSHYTSTFMMRFPVLYFTVFSASLYLAAQRNLYLNKMEKMAYVDIMTDLFNRRHYDDLRVRIDRNGSMDMLTVISVDVNNLKAVNDKIGHAAGDEIVIATAQCLKKSFDKAEAICRTGGDEFMVVTYQPADVIEAQLKRLDAAAAAWTGKYAEHFSVSVGIASHEEFPEDSFEELEKKADMRMYARKMMGADE